MTNSPSKAKDFPAELTAADLAAVCGVSARRLNQLAAEGVIKRASRGWYHSDGIASFVAHKAAQAEARAERRAVVTPLQAERALSLRIKNNAAEARLMPTDEAVSTIKQIASDVCTALASVQVPVDLPSATRENFAAGLCEIVTSIESRTKHALAALVAGTNPLDERILR